MEKSTFISTEPSFHVVFQPLGNYNAVVFVEVTMPCFTTKLIKVLCFNALKKKEIKKRKITG